MWSSAYIDTCDQSVLGALLCYWTSADTTAQAAAGATQQGEVSPQPEAAAESTGGLPCINAELQVYNEDAQRAADTVL